MEFAASVTPWIHLPTAFLDPSDCPLYKELESASKQSSEKNTSSHHWERCFSNPLNKLDSIQPLAEPRWRIDGCCGRGTQFFALPVFPSSKLIPYRMDVFIPDQAKHPGPLRSLLQSGEAFYTQDSSVNRLGICQFILKVLELWSSKFDFAKVFEVVPFGSRIVIENITSSVQSARVRIIPNIELEQQLLSVEELQGLWNLNRSQWPSTIELRALKHLSQMHDSISLVQIPSISGDKLYIFKSSNHSYRYIYHELKMLLTMPSHENMISKPCHIVLGQTVSSQETKVYGFILEYHEGGTLGKVLTQRTAKNTLRIKDQFRWARQITSALICIRDGPAKYYSELKPDNILVKAPDDDILLIDFEQHANWDSFSAPEIRHVDNLEKLLKTNFLSDDQHQFYENLIRPHLKDTAGTPFSERYTDPPAGYYNAWNSLDPVQQESAMVYALGKILWCIFEGQDHTRNTLLEEYIESSLVEFPSFAKTPQDIQKLIYRCTLGSDEWEEEVAEVTRVGDKFYRRGWQGEERSGLEGARDALLAAQTMWKQRLKRMEVYLGAKKRWLDGVGSAEDVTLLGFTYRPRLNEVLNTLLDIEKVTL
jgi:hypothetical protein